MSLNHLVAKKVCIPYERGKIFPLFIPFAGCPNQCIFCSQEKQTGKGKQSVKEALEQAYRDFPAFLENAFPKRTPKRQKVIDIAFYGGTFTAIAPKDFKACLEFFSYCRNLAEQKKIKVIGRCSTRPDALKKQRLQQLKKSGINLIELGIQSFDDNVLSLSRRGYTGTDAKQACQEVLGSGFELGIQLMAGLPGQDEEVFLKDVEEAICLIPHCMRFYPCLVPAGTELAKYFQEGTYSPWSNEQCIETVGKALAYAWKDNIPVIRLTVAPEEEFDQNLLAGPRHPSLGSDIQAYAIYDTIAFVINQALANYPEAEIKAKILIPQNLQGCFYGTKNWLKKSYACLVAEENIVFEDSHPGQILFFINFNWLTS